MFLFNKYMHDIMSVSKWACGSCGEVSGFPFPREFRTIGECVFLRVDVCLTSSPETLFKRKRIPCSQKMEKKITFSHCQKKLIYNSSVMFTFSVPVKLLLKQNENFGTYNLSREWNVKLKWSFDILIEIWENKGYLKGKSRKP